MEQLPWEPGRAKQLQEGPGSHRRQVNEVLGPRANDSGQLPQGMDLLSLVKGISALQEG